MPAYPAPSPPLGVLTVPLSTTVCNSTPPTGMSPSTLPSESTSTPRTTSSPTLSSFIPAVPYSHTTLPQAKHVPRATSTPLALSSPQVPTADITPFPTAIPDDAKQVEVLVVGIHDLCAKSLATQFVESIYLPEEHEFTPGCKIVMAGLFPAKVHVTHISWNNVEPGLLQLAPSSSLVVYVQSRTDCVSFGRLEEALGTLHKKCKARTVMCVIDSRKDITEESAPNTKRYVRGAEFLSVLTKLEHMVWMLGCADVRDTGSVWFFFQEVLSNFLSKTPSKKIQHWSHSLPEPQHSLPRDLIEKVCTGLQRTKTGIPSSEEEMTLDTLIHSLVEFPGVTLRDLLCFRLKKKLLFLEEKSFFGLMSHYQQFQNNFVEQVHPTYQLLYEDTLKHLSSKIVEKPLRDVAPNSTTVSLDFLFLSKFPEKPLSGVSSSLTALNLSHNCLVEIPSSISFLRNLLNLNLSWNNLTCLPASLSLLFNLTTLNVATNATTELDAPFGTQAVVM
ncbi:hypothetical protein Pelo_14979 [Pelomyxa schiedti]|nr:hypothetical protein Pelo_14979 [Pelomyxa schiedti]